MCGLIKWFAVLYEIEFIGQLEKQCCFKYTPVFDVQEFYGAILVGVEKCMWVLEEKSLSCLHLHEMLPLLLSVSCFQRGRKKASRKNFIKYVLRQASTPQSWSHIMSRDVMIDEIYTDTDKRASFLALSTIVLLY